MLIEGLGFIGDRVNQKAANTHDMGCLSGTQHGVLQQRGSDSFSLSVAIDGQTAKDCHGNRVGHVAPDRSRRVGDRQRSR